MNKKTKSQLEAELRVAQKRIAELESAGECDERFALIFAASPSQMALTDTANGQYVEVNEAFLRTLGFSRDEVIGKTALEMQLFVNPAQRAELIKRMDVQGYLRSEHVLVHAKTGEIRHGIFSAEYVHANGQKLLLTVMNDITEKTQAEERWQFALEGAGDGVWDLNIQTNRVFYSPQWKSMLGYEEDEIGDSMDEWLTRIHPNDLPAVLENVNQHLEKGTQQYSSEYRIRCKNGTYKWVLARGKIVEWTEDKKPLRVIGTHKDISERKEAEEKLRADEGRYRALVEALDISLCRWLPDTTLTFANEKYIKIFGVQGNAAGQKWIEFLPEESRASTAAFYGEVTENPRTVTYEHPVTVEDGSLRQYQWIDAPILDEGGKVLEFQSVGIDITERKRAEDLISAQRDLARMVSADISDEVSCEFCLQTALRVSMMDSGGMYLLNENSRALELVYHQGFGADFVKAVAQFTEEMPSARMILSGKTFYFTESDLLAQKYHAAEGLLSVAVIPIQHQGQGLGCLNIASHVFASVPDFSRSVLESIAAEIGNIIIYQRTEKSLQVSHEQLSRTLMTARMGTWRWHVPTNQVEWSPEAARIFGVDMAQGGFDMILEHFHPEDRPRAVSALQESLAQKKLLNFEYRILDAAGNVRWVTNYGHVEYDL